MSAKGLILAAWVILVCVLSGALAVATDQPSLWGGGGVFLEYALPVPWGWGLMHLPGLAGFGVLLAACMTDAARWCPAARWIATGTLLGVASAAFLVEALRGLPLLLFLSVDALTVLAIATLVPVASAGPWSPRSRTLMLIGPALLVVLGILITPLLRERFRVSMTDTVEDGNGQSLRVFVRLQGAPRSRTQECAGLADLAEQYRNRFTQRGSDRPMDGVVLLFPSGELISRDNAGSARLRYAWTHGEADRCSG